MVFKKLELSGFKSFAEKTTLVFEPGVTAIVGPNGSGKSNLADAIKWVLGEQSARELRGGHMEDLIFNGTDGRPPLNVAEVSLTFDNTAKLLPTEYSEVTVTRRLYRSGESEYLLNKTTVRLKDIVELLMGTGIGTSAYSLFEQGKMDQLIQARPEERRAIFEEASGITKYKTQKREALRRLEQTEANLLRLNDVIVEVRRQLTALERQVKKAQVYREQWERLKTLEVTLAQREYHRVQADRAAREQEAQSVHAREEALQGRVREAEAALGERRAELERVDQAYAQARAEVQRIAHAIEIAQQQITTHQERIAEGQRRRTQAAQEITALLQQRAQAIEQITVLRQALAETEPERQRSQAALTEAQARMAACEEAIRQAQATIQAQKDTVVDTLARTSQLRNELMKQAAQVHTLQARVQRLDVESGRVQQERQTVATQVEALAAALASSREQEQRVQAECAERQAVLASSVAQTAVAEQALQRAQETFIALHSRYEVLQGLVASQEGLSTGVKTLLDGLRQQAVSSDGVVGLLADALQVETGYEAAVEAALGDLAQAIVVESWEVAARCLAYVQRANAGRVTLLVRPAVRAGSGAPTQPTGTYEPIARRVRATPALESLVEALLEHTYVVPDIATAVEWQRTAIVPLRLVTLLGERITATSVIGGAPGSGDSAVVGRQQRLTQVASDVAASRGAVGAAQQHLDEARVVEQTLQAAMAAWEQASQAQRAAIAQDEAQHATLGGTLQKLDDELALLQTEREEGRVQWTEAQSEETAVRSALTDIEAQAEQAQAAITQAQQQIETVSRDREGQAIAAAQAQAQLASVDQMRAGREQSLALVEQSQQGMQATIAAREAEIVELAARETEWTAQCEAATREIASHQQAGTLSEQSLQTVTSQRTALVQSIAREAEGVQAIAAEFDGVRQRLHEHELSTAQLTYQQESLTSRLRQVYQVEFEPAAEAPQEQPWETITQECETLRRKLEGIGPVSLASIDESRELQERLTFLTNQQADLQKAKDDLHEAITKINRTTRTQFKETFQKIQLEFQNTFRTLFGGGEARLVLLDEEDLLESGIEIVARPPGKTAQSISLLSGGEKALTSVALLFAIFRVKPSPFCLLDEIDAPLDEANVDRFTRALKEFLRDSQFIIITHNKKTIVMADVMYGVTMEQQGVSKIVSVKLQDRAEPPAADAPQPADPTPATN